MEMPTSEQYQESLKDRYEEAVASWGVYSSDIDLTQISNIASEKWKADYIKWYCNARNFVTFLEWSKNFPF